MPERILHEELNGDKFTFFYGLVKVAKENFKVPCTVNLNAEHLHNNACEIQTSGVLNPEFPVKNELRRHPRTPQSILLNRTIKINN